MTRIERNLEENLLNNLAKELDIIQKQLQDYEYTLEFYAQRANWYTNPGSGDCDIVNETDLGEDKDYAGYGGNRARTVLNRWNPEL